MVIRQHEKKDILLRAQYYYIQLELGLGGACRIHTHGAGIHAGRRLLFAN